MNTLLIGKICTGLCAERLIPIIALIGLWGKNAESNWARSKCVRTLIRWAGFKFDVALRPVIGGKCFEMQSTNWKSNWEWWLSAWASNGQWKLKRKKPFVWLERVNRKWNYCEWRRNVWFFFFFGLCWQLFQLNCQLHFSPDRIVRRIQIKRLLKNVPLIRQIDSYDGKATLFLCQKSWF